MKKEEITDSHYLILIVFTLIAIVGVFIQVHPFTVQKSSVVLDQKKPAITDTNLQKVPDTTAIFRSEIFLERDTTKVVVPFKFQTNPYMLTLALAVEPETAARNRVLFHPLLQDLQWPRISNDTLHLYQKPDNYESIDDFLNDPPQEATIVVDSHLTNRYPELNAQPLTDSLNLDAVDYILTTFKPASILDSGLYQAEYVIDASEGIVNQDNQLTWSILSQLASPENPYYLGMIHVDYD